jgi:hypothetical protein
MHYSVDYSRWFRMFSNKSGKRKLIERTLICRFVPFSKYTQYDTILEFKIRSLVLSNADLAYLKLAGVLLPKYADILNITENFLHNHMQGKGNYVVIVIELGIEDLVDASHINGTDLTINNQLLSKKGKFYVKNI